MKKMSNVATIEFFDEESSDAVFISVRRCGNKIGLCVSLRSDGDVETFLDRPNAERLLRALEEALRDGET